VLVAAQLVTIGMDGMAFLTAHDPVQRLAMLAVADKAADLLAEHIEARD
jgi:hypothetical protein